jgi:LacI family transcriptional regulator
LDAAKELNYGPFAKESHVGSLNEVVVFVPSMSNPYYPQVVACLEDMLHEYNYNLVLCCTGGDVKKEKDLLVKFGACEISGIIYCYTPTQYELLAQLSDKIPVTIIGESDHEEIVTVALDSRQAGYMAAKHLYNLGHRKIAFISGNMESVSLSRKRRLDGMRMFVSEKNDMEDITVYTDLDESEDKDDIGRGYELTQKLFAESSRKNTAIIGVNDYTAIGIVNAIRDLGIEIPQQISVMGFDNIEMANNIAPKLTTIDHCIKERCAQAVDIVKNGSVTRRITYHPVLIERNSTSKI